MDVSGALIDVAFALRRAQSTGATEDGKAVIAAVVVYGDARAATAASMLAAIRAALARQDSPLPFREVVEGILAGKVAP